MNSYLDLILGTRAMEPADNSHHILPGNPEVRFWSLISTPSIVDIKRKLSSFHFSRVHHWGGRLLSILSTAFALCPCQLLLTHLSNKRCNALLRCVLHPRVRSLTHLHRLPNNENNWHAGCLCEAQHPVLNAFIHLYDKSQILSCYY